MGKFEEVKENAAETATCFAEEHPVATSVGMGLIGLVAAVPLCAMAYKYAGKCAGKSAAKELLAAGVKLGYNHD